MAAKVRRASGWRRLAAFGVDYLLILLYMAALATVSLMVAAPLLAKLAAPWQAQLLGFTTLTLPVTLYFAFGESLSGATFGKRRLGLTVTGLAGARLPLGRSLLRSTAKFAPWELAHTAVHRLVWWTADGATLVGWQLAWLAWFYGASLLLAALYLLSLWFGTRRTPYDRLAGSQVLVAPSRLSGTLQTMHHTGGE